MDQFTEWKEYIKTIYELMKRMIQNSVLLRYTSSKKTQNMSDNFKFST